ncbi:MAG: hypothetical protein WCF95_05710 [bacterium]
MSTVDNDSTKLAIMKAAFNEKKLKLDEYSSIPSESIFSKFIENPSSYHKIGISDAYAMFLQDMDPTNSLQDGIIGSFKQGCVGDCWFLARLKSIQEKDPELIKNLIKNNGNGTFSVKFPGAEKPFDVTEEELKSGKIKIGKSEHKLSTGDKDVRLLEIAAVKALGEDSKTFLKGSNGDNFRNLFYPKADNFVLAPMVTKKEEKQFKNCATKYREVFEKYNKSVENNAPPQEIKHYDELLKYYKYAAISAEQTLVPDIKEKIQKVVDDPNCIVNVSFLSVPKGTSLEKDHLYSVKKEGDSFILTDPWDTSKEIKIGIEELLSCPGVGFNVISELKKDQPPK